MSNMDERKPFVKKSDLLKTVENRNVHIYNRRWWVTAVFSLLCFTQVIIWDTWGSIAESSELVFGWTNGTIAQIMNVSSISFVIIILPFSIFLDIKGLRISVLLSSFVLLVAAVIRCIRMSPVIFTSIAHVSSVLQGIGGAIAFAGPAMFSAVWFPLKQRATATAVASFFNNFGLTISFIIGPQLVPNPVYTVNNVNPALANQSFNNQPDFFNYTELNRSSDEGSVGAITNMDAMRSGILYLMYLHASLAGLVFVLALVYFPDKPPTPPSMTASLPRTNYREGLKSIICNVQLWIIVIVGSLPRAVFGSWISVFDMVVKPLGVSQIDAGWIGFWHTLTGSIAGIVFATFSSLLKSKWKVLVISTTVTAVLFNIWVVLLCDRIIDFNITSLYVSCIVLGVLVNGTGPLFYEISAETAYPVGEGLAGGFYTLMWCIFEITFFSILSIPNIGVSWMTWLCVVSLILSLPLMAIFKERNKRYSIDIDVQFNNK